MPANRKVLMLPGDGIGPEVMGEVKRLVGWFDKRRSVGFDLTEELCGGCAIDKHGVPVTEATMQQAMDADAVLLGAVGGPKWANVDFAIRPEAALLRLRKDLELFANLRPAIVFPALADASTLKAEVVAGLDILILRELTGGVYFGEPRGITTLPNGERRGVNTQVYTTHEIVRVARVGFELARLRSKKLCSVEKSNVMESGLLWREEVTKLHASYKDVELSHMLRRQLRHAARAQPEAVRRHRHRQSVRRHAVGRGLDAHRLARDAALCLARRRRRLGPAPRVVRAGARHGARHRRAEQGQPAGHDPAPSP